MSDGSCIECGGKTVWDDEVGSSICTACGTLLDPTQSVLSTQMEITDISGREYFQWSSSTTLKSIVRGKSGWDLAGQGREARNEKNLYAMNQYIRSLSSSLATPGLAPRANAIFSLAMEKGRYKWGAKAKLTAGAALAIALREAHRPDSLRDIAFLLDCPHRALTHAFSHIVKLLGLDLVSADPAQYFSTVQTHFATLLDPTITPLPSSLLSVLKQISSSTVMHTAASLSSLLYHHPSLVNLPTQSTACAFFLLSLEAESNSPLPHLGSFADALATRFAVSGKLIMARYKIIQDLVEEWIREVPWLKRFEGKMTKRGGKKSKRTVIARGLKDMLQFREEIQTKKLSVAARPSVQLELDSDGDANDDPDDCTERPRKRRKTKPIEEASRFLLDPLTAPVPRTLAHPITPKNTADDISLTSYLLLASPAEHLLSCAPTRLQRLSAERGGEAAVDDEELFTEDEWEGFFRTEDERNILQKICGWNSCEDTDNQKPQKGPTIKQASRGAGRVNMVALARLFEDGKDDGAYPPSWDEEVEAWRPLSPDGLCESERYDEEY